MARQLNQRTIKEFIDTNLLKMSTPGTSLQFGLIDKEIFEFLNNNGGNISELSKEHLQYVLQNKDDTGMMGVFYREFQTLFNREMQNRAEGILHLSGTTNDKKPGAGW